MSTNLADLLDLANAWKRVKNDVLKDRVFVRLPYEIEIIETDIEKWLKSLKERLESNAYSPSNMTVCEVVKPGGAIRPGGHLVLEDRIIYTACLDVCYENIYETLKWANAVDYSYRLRSPDDKRGWFEDWYSAHKKFNSACQTKIEEGASYVVMTDICGYYENIDIYTLISILSETGSDETVIEQISNCLNKWAVFSGKGIPQGHSPSDILGKLYLNYVDHSLTMEGFVHTRWVDDYRIFCGSLVEAKKAIIILNKLLRERGLNLQSAKTKIYNANEAINEINRVENRLLPIKTELENRAKLFYQPLYPSMPSFILDQILRANPDEVSREVIILAFKQYFIENNTASFDKTLFRYLLNRLKIFKDGYAVEYCKKALTEHPEETDAILPYFEEIEATEQVVDFLTEHLKSDKAIYDYQNYQIIFWFCEIEYEFSIITLATVRKILTGQKHIPFYLWSVCVDFIGKYGTPNDLESLKNLYKDVSGVYEQCVIISSLRRMEKKRRNQFLGRCKNDSELHQMAFKLIKSFDDKGK